ncbi:MAG: hypothetical protein KDC18_08365 [Alphaproteobacteria bacterium]|nr:hypothetical protein [Alphaproteobacteria bacterium]MCB9929755.1 hypothetical protein [Alphaproteobacteria bacterium]
MTHTNASPLSGRARALVLALGLALAACSGVQTQPPDPDSQDHRGVPKGPGVLSGQSGEWVILSK